MARLTAWKALADDRQFESLFHRILDASGVIRRELFAGAGERRLTNYLHIFDRLLEETAAGRRGLRDLITQLAGFIHKHKPDPEDGNIQRRESDRDAVQIMTMHKAKGLEAEVVFLYGGFTGFRGGFRRVRPFTEGGERVVTFGRPRRAALEAKLKTEQAQEDQRLLYVALTRAKSRLYLPYFGGLPEGDEEMEGPSGNPEPAVWDKLRGGYRHINRRLRALVEDPVFRDERRVLFAGERVPCPPDEDADGDGEGAAALARRQALALWQPRLDAAALAAAEAPATPAPTTDGSPALPGGAQSGIFLHAVLEAIPLESLADRPTLADWLAMPAVQTVFARAMSRFDRQPEHLADAARLVFAALTTPVALSPTVTLPGIATAEKILREVEFLYPVAPGNAAADAQGFVKGFIDFVIEADGRTWLGDWKSDHLPVWDAAHVGAHVQANYDIQARLYAIALVKMLGVADAADYEARFGGMLFVFLRGLPEGVFVWRPTFAEVTRWRDELATTVGARGEEPLS